MYFTGFFPGNRNFFLRTCRADPASSPNFHPIADPRAVVSAPHVRFTVLTSRLLRLEFSPTDHFENARLRCSGTATRQPRNSCSPGVQGISKSARKHLELDFLASEDGFTHGEPIDPGS